MVDTTILTANTMLRQGECRLMFFKLIVRPLLITCTKLSTGFSVFPNYTQREHGDCYWLAEDAHSSMALILPLLLVKAHCWSAPDCFFVELWIQNTVLYRKTCIEMLDYLANMIVNFLYIHVFIFMYIIESIYFNLQKLFYIYTYQIIQLHKIIRQHIDHTPISLEFIKTIKNH